MNTEGETYQGLLLHDILLQVLSMIPRDEALHIT
jgi:hypothetical protein